VEPEEAAFVGRALAFALEKHAGQTRKGRDVPYASHPVRVAGLVLEAVNARLQRAEIGHELAERRAFGTPAGAAYRVTGRRVDVSLYSVGDFDVARIAESLGGGGHRNAAGFSVTLDEWLARYLSAPESRRG
jgi:nanoRNase/pAp phosphatase (c-di-AMP/oligoRNAs hydrolase)